MWKWIVGTVSLLVITSVLLVVANKSNSKSPEIDSKYYDVGDSDISQDADIPDNQQANIDEQVGQIDLNNSENMHQDTTSKNLSKPELTIDTTKIYEVTLKTTKGDIVIHLNSKVTPITANNFVYLANNNFYDNTIFHRVINGFMIQGGDPTGTGTGSPGYKFDDEPFKGEYTRGTVAMANSGPNTNGSQFFIMQKDNPLPKNYVIFGSVVSGMDVVDTIASAEVKTSFSGEKSVPVDPVTITDVVVTEK